MTSIDPVPGHAIDYQNLGGDAYEIVVGGQATQGTVIPVGKTDWVAISRRGTVLGYQLSKDAAPPASSTSGRRAAGPDR